MTGTTRRQLLHAAAMGAGALALPRFPAFAAPAPTAVAIAGDPLGPGFWVLLSDGSVRARGSAKSVGGGVAAPGAFTGLAAHPTGGGFWRAKRTGAVLAHGRATTRVGAAPDRRGKVVGIAPHRSGGGLWRVTAQGQVLASGNSEHLGAPRTAAAIAGIAAHPQRGYWILSRAGEVFAFGAARRLGQPGGAGWTGLAVHPSGDGYWLVKRDGTVAAYGASRHHGNARTTKPIHGIAAAADGQGYWLLKADGRVAAFGSAADGIMTTAPPPDPDLAAAGGIVVASSIARRVRALLEHADDDGLKLGGWGYRAYARQVELRRQNCGVRYYDVYVKASSECSPMTARPGSSLHERGLAIDFYRRMADGSSGEIAGSRAFRWLQRNAATYGLYNLPSEPWHWSTTGG